MDLDGCLGGRAVFQDVASSNPAQDNVVLCSVRINMKLVFQTNLLFFQISHHVIHTFLGHFAFTSITDVVCCGIHLLSAAVKINRELFKRIQMNSNKKTQKRIK
jgi:hypothetical protein